MSIEFKLDGKTVTAEPGQTILEVARANGIRIPTLCRESRITKMTSCFVCVVRDCKTGKFMPSCAACPSNGQEIEASSEAVLDMRKTALNLLLSEHSGDCEAPCTLACPAHANVEEYVRAGREGDFLKALKIVKERIPLPMSIGRVCPRFCEKQCRRNVYGKPVAINEFKRLAADLFYDEYNEEIPAPTGKRVAIVGGGPAGLSAAYYLRRAGVAATVFEAMPKAGGMIRYGIPEYRLPKHAVLDRELAHFEKMGVEFKFNQKLGRDFTVEALEKEYDAVILAIGCWKASGMRCEGEELVTQGIDFLRGVIENDCKAANPGRVIVVGGGNTAMDCVRTSVRLGASKVSCFYRRTEAEMPAEKLEIAEAREEGVEFTFLVAPVKVEKRGNVLVLTCRKMELGEPDASGRRKPVEIPGSDFEVEADTIIGAIGQGMLPTEGVPVSKFRTVEVVDGCKVRDRVYAAGDCLTGAKTVVEAVAGGHRACDAILRDVVGLELPAEHTVFVSRGNWQDLSKEDLVFIRDNVSDADRAKLDYIPLEERKHSFKEVCSTMPKERVMKEGERCIECSCTDKHDCKLREHGECYGCNPDLIKGGKQKTSYDVRHPLIIQDRGKCIKCTTCVKICKEVINQTLLSPQKRGFFTYIGTSFDKGFPKSCAECGACIEACPTGALAWRKKE